MSRAFLLCLALILVACGPRPAREGAPVAASGVPRFGDSDPVDWPAGQAPSTHPVHGVDVSVWQGPIDWRAARADGVSFAYLKATEGGDRVDPAFAGHWAATRAAGIPRGAYHFFYHCRPAIEQARWFLAHVPRDASALPPVLDMEWNSHSPTCPGRRPAAEVRAEARTFLSAIARATGKRPLLYTTVDFYAQNALWQLDGVDFWLRSTAKHPSDSFPGQHWLIWQYTATGRVDGIAGPVDLDAFAHGPRAFSAWAGGIDAR